MNFNEAISTLAFSLSIVEMFSEVKKADFVSVEHKNIILLSLFTSCLWFIYQYRTIGTNATTLATGLGIFVQLYILNKILLKEQKDLKIRSEWEV